MITLLNMGLDIELRNKSGQTALHMAAIDNAEAVARALIGRRADVNRRDTLGRTALHWACINGHVGMVKLLQSNMADKDAADQEVLRVYCQT
jgi:ankyrin repeat protein